jgi:hypothetical protein
MFTPINLFYDATTQADILLIEYCSLTRGDIAQLVIELDLGLVPIFQGCYYARGW